MRRIDSALTTLTSSLVGRPLSVTVVPADCLAIEVQNNTLMLGSNTPDPDVVRALAAIGVGRMLDDSSWARKAYDAIPKKYRGAIPACWSVLAHHVAVRLAGSKHPILGKRIRRGLISGVGELDYNSLPSTAANVLRYVARPSEANGRVLNATTRNTIDNLQTQPYDKQLIGLARLVGDAIPPGTQLPPLGYTPATRNGDGVGLASWNEQGSSEPEVARYAPPTPDMAAERHFLASVTEDMLRAGQPEWLTGTSRGKIDLRAARQVIIDPQRMFKTMKYDPVPPSRLRVVLDSSASMREHIDTMAQISWACRGWKLGQMDTWVFSDTVHVWDKHHDSAVAVPQTTGGTLLSEAIARASEDLTARDFLVILSDGDISDPDKDAVYDAIDNTYCTVLSWGGNVEYTAPINNMRDLMQHL